ncbi:helix-turn-helix domain-containing protein [Nocardioides thalensis]
MSVSDVVPAAAGPGPGHATVGGHPRRLKTCATQGGPVSTADGLRILPDGPLEEVAEAETVLVPRWRAGHRPPEELLQDLERARAGGVHLVSVGSGLDLLRPAGRRAGHGPGTALLQVLAHVLDEAADSPPSVRALAAAVGVSPRTLTRRFADELGVSPGQWLLDRRLDRACALLVQTDLPVDAIARRVGYASAAGLRRHFWRRWRTSPGHYRALRRG